MSGYNIFPSQVENFTPKNNGTINFLGLCSNQQLSFFTLLDRTYLLHYNQHQDHQIWLKTFYFMSNFYIDCHFCGFAINLSSCLKTLEIGQITKITVHIKCLIKWKVFNQIWWSGCYYGWEIDALSQQSEEITLLIRAKSWKSTVSTVALILGHPV